MSKLSRLILTVMLAVSGVAASHASQQLVFFGTGGRDGDGIYVSRLDLDTGTLSPPELAAEIAGPGFLAIHPGKKFLYCVSGLDGADRGKTGGVTAFGIDPAASGKLKQLNQQASGGSGPCHLTVDPSGRCVLVANYGGGSVAVLPINDDGSLAAASAFVQHEGSSVNPKRQDGPHAHSINVDSGNRFAMAADLGLDEVLIYAFDPGNGTLKPHGSGIVKAGAGPRHFAFHPNDKFAFVINELASTITSFAYDADNGTLKEVQTITTLPDDFEGTNSTAEVQVHPTGRFVYGSNRGHDTVAVFACDPETGILTFVEREPIRGQIPRNFGIDPTGTFLLAAGQQSNSVAVFRIDPDTGALDYAGSEIEVPGPICVKFLEIE